MIMSEKITVDTNVLIYLHDETIAFKKRISLEIIAKKTCYCRPSYFRVFECFYKIDKKVKININ